MYFREACSGTVFQKGLHGYRQGKQALLQITGLGFYELHVNGGNITKGYLAPYRSNPEDLVYFDPMTLQTA